MRITGSRANDSPGFEIIKIDGVVRRTACTKGELTEPKEQYMALSFFMSYIILSNM